MEFDWDPQKAANNLAKHGVSFDVVLDWDWSRVRTVRLTARHDEPRWVAVYRGDDGKCLVAVYTRGAASFGSSVCAGRTKRRRPNGKAEGID